MEKKPPTVQELSRQFIIPKQQMGIIAKWMGIKCSTLYAVLGGRSKLSQANIQRLITNLKLDNKVFDINLPIDYRRCLLYSVWYKHQAQIEELF